ncbi:MAG: holo-[acyl-carrier-protein] synthase [Planctomycetes bacterium]|nr:holo-[acyl-carrier-protein] synthase [Planctomycetota bacterium]
MPIVSLGLDLTQIARIEQMIERHGERFLARVFTVGEREYCEHRPRTRAAHYGGRFAVKEAVMKVLGTGWTRGVRWIDIEVVRKSGGAPELVLHGVSARIAKAKGIARIHITITHDAGIAAAAAVAEG